MKVLITGGAGFLGSHLAERLAERAEIVLLDNMRRDALSLVPNLAQKPGVRIKVVNGDVRDPDLVRRAADGADVVLHLAAIAGVNSYYREPLETLQVNILGTCNVLGVVADSRVPRLVYLSTSEVYGPDALWVSETGLLSTGPTSDARWVYAASKLASEHFCLRWGEKAGFGVTVLRPFNVYGPRQVGEGAIANFCRAVVQGEPMKVYGDGGAIRAWCYVSDLADAVMATLEKREAIGEVFNVGNPREVETTLGLARRITQLVPGSRYEFQQVNRTDVRARVPVIDKARKLLGFEPKVDLETGLSKTLEEYRRRPAEVL